MEDTEVSKICLEYWNALSADLYRESPFRSLIINYCAPDPDPCSMTFWIRMYRYRIQIRIHALKNFLKFQRSISQLEDTC